MLYDRKWLKAAAAVLLVLLAGFLLWAWQQVWRAEQRRIRTAVEEVVSHTADALQRANLTLNNQMGSYRDKDAAEKLAFAIGMTGNSGKMRISFEEAEEPAGSDTVPRLSQAWLQQRRISFRPDLVKGIAQFRAALQDSLRAARLDIRYAVDVLHARPSDSSAAGHVWQVRPFIINYYDPVVYCCAYSIPAGLILQRIWPYTLASALILLLVAASMQLFFRSLSASAQVNEFRYSLFSNATHELKTPLTSLQLITSAFREEPESGMAIAPYEHIVFARKELARMKLLVSRILAYGRMDTAQLALDKEAVRLRDVVDDAIAALQLLIHSRAAVIEVAGDAPAPLYADRALLTNLFMALLENAIRHNPAIPLIRVTLGTGPGVVTAAVADNGPGIAADQQPHIFEPFFRGRNSHMVPGHGLGLSFVQQVARLHRGSVRLTSRAGAGSTFTLTLPCS